MSLELGTREVAFTASDGAQSSMWITGSGDSEAAPVVLLHGLSQQAGFWSPVIRRLRHRPVIAFDLRGHGVSTASASSDFSVERVAADIDEALATLSVQRAHIAGHSWGGSVALALAANSPDLVASVSLIDGGLWTFPDLPRTAMRERLRPPELGVPEHELWDQLAHGELAASWSTETHEALARTFTTEGDGLMRTRIGIDRHMAVVDGLLDFDAWAAATAVACPIWLAMCLDRSGDLDERAQTTLTRARTLPTLLVHRWTGAIHDVPLQWPGLVAGFIEALVESSAQSDRRQTR